MNDRRAVEVFVSSKGNAFMRDIAEWVTEAAVELGHPATLRLDGAPPADPTRLNLVVAPHEFYLLGGFDDPTIHAATAISAPICTEQPGTKWFELTEIVARNSPIVFDINEHGVEALRAGGFDAHHLRLGGVASMRAPERSERTNDVLFLGGKTPRRAAQVAALAPQLWNRVADIRMFSFSRPVDDDVPGLVFGEAKYELLADSRILINVHRDDRTPGYFEWARMVEAMANGCCVLTEPVTGFEPFVPGADMVVSDDLPSALAELLDEPDRVVDIGERARHSVLVEHPLSAALAPALDALDATQPNAPLLTETGSRVPHYNRELHVAERHPLLGPFAPFHREKDTVYRALIEEVQLQRRIDRARCAVRHGEDRYLEISTTPAYRDLDRPVVSAVVTLFNYADPVVETLQSLAASQTDDGAPFPLELVVVDDHSTDDSRAVVEAFMHEHPAVAIRLVGAEFNSGLPGARNLGFAQARSDYVMVIDADNLVYPTAIARLAAALDADPNAAFAYSTMEEFGVETGLRSAMSWYVPRLCEENYIDAQAMFRRSIWQRVGGYSTADELVFGWEDWELWLRLASLGEYGVHVAQMLGRYRVQERSMLSTTNLVASSIHRWLMSSYRNLPWPHPLPDEVLDRGD